LAPIDLLILTISYTGSSVSSLSLAAGASTSLLSGSRLIDIPGNEIADKAVKEVTLEGRRDNFKLPTSDPGSQQNVNLSF